jgi:DNA modification methylase
MKQCAYRDMNQIIQGDCLDILPELPGKHFHCCVTSPPYYGLRDYKVSGRDWPSVAYHPMPGLPELAVPEWHGCLGMEPTPEMFAAHIVLIFRDVWRVLRDDGTLWLNFGDSYASAWAVSRRNVVGQGALEDGTRPNRPNRLVNGLKEKDLTGIPWRVAFALQADGWYLRQDVIWGKLNPMPESVRDRCTKAHEYIFLLSKSERYYYDNEAIKDPATKEDLIPGQGYKQHRMGRASGNKSHKYVDAYNSSSNEEHRLKSGLLKVAGVAYQKRNKRSVWPVATQPCSEAHFAVYPPALIEPCILAGAPVDGEVLDPFGGAGTTGIVCKRHRRNYTLIELSPEHCEIAQRRIAKEPHPQLTIFDALQGESV